MSLSTKKFDKELHASNDNLAKSTIKSMSKDSIFDIREGDTDYSVDLKVYHNDLHIANIECEVKRVWQGKFKWDSVQIPDRKRKYCILDKPTFFIVFNNDCSEYIIIKSDTLMNSIVTEVKNKYVLKGEKFFQVMLKDLNNLDLEGELCKLIKT